MSLELWSVIASIGTFVVITATAIAAVLQLRHIEAANKVAYIRMLMQEYEGPEMRDAFRFVRSELASRLEDPEFRRELRAGRVDRDKHPEVTVCNLFDHWGLYFRDGAIDRESFLRINAGVNVSFWDTLAPAIALMADPIHGNLSFQDFEYMAIKSRQWLEAHPNGDFPSDERRLPLVDRWAEVDGVEMR